MDRYLPTIPHFECQATYTNCITDHPNDLAGQNACEEAYNQFCNNYVNASDSNPQVTLTSVANVVVTITTLSSISRTTEQVTLQIIKPSGIPPLSSPATTTTSKPSSPRSFATPTNSPASSSPTISKAALGVAIALPIAFVLALAACMLWIFRRHRHRRQKAERENPVDEKPTWERMELAAGDETEVRRKELPPENALHELPAGREVGREELDGRKADVSRVEMHANEPIGAEVSSNGTDEVGTSHSGSGAPSDAPFLTEWPGAEKVIERKEVPNRLGEAH